VFELSTAVVKLNIKVINIVEVKINVYNVYTAAAARP